MVRERLGRATRAALLLLVGIQGLGTPLAGAAVRGSTPDCVEASPLVALVGAAAHVIAATPDCPHGTFSPAGSYLTFAQAVLTASLAATLLGVVALLSVIGLGLTTQQTLRRVRRWLRHRFRIAVAELPFIAFARQAPAHIPTTARPRRVVSQPHVRRGPPSCSC